MLLKFPVFIVSGFCRERKKVVTIKMKLIFSIKASVVVPLRGGRSYASFVKEMDSARVGRIFSTGAKEIHSGGRLDLRINVRSNLEFETDETSSGQFIIFKGSINENSAPKLEEVSSVAQSKVFFNLQEVNFINSVGIKNWITFLSDLKPNRTIEFVKVSPIIIRQLNMIPEIALDFNVTDFFGEFVCDECGLQKQVLFDATLGYEELLNRYEEIPCENCEGSMELDESPDEYFSFLIEEAEE